jgi:hypothetical protein
LIEANISVPLSVAAMSVPSPFAAIEYSPYRQSDVPAAAVPPVEIARLAAKIVVSGVK